MARFNLKGNSPTFGSADGFLQTDHRPDIQDFARLIDRFKIRGPDVTKTRVVVGERGSGKSEFLRALAADDDEGDGRRSIDMADLPPEVVSSISHEFSDNLLVAKWSQIWKRGILRASATRVLFDPNILKYVPPETRGSWLIRYSSRLLWDPTRASLPSDEVDSICRYFADSDPHGFNHYLQDPLWDELEYELGAALKSTPRLSFYIDFPSDCFDVAPQQWLACQQGLFFQVMRLLRDSRLGSRIRLVVALREITYMAALRSEHQARYRGEPHIRLLDWSFDAIRLFLESRVSRRVPRSRGGTDSRHPESTVAAWLGTADIWNQERGVSEKVDNYLLRHTRYLPRDVITMLNSLEGSRSHTDGVGKIDMVRYRRTISDVASQFAVDQLVSCAQRIEADSGDVTSEYAEFHAGHRQLAFLDGTRSTRGTVGQLLDVIVAIGKERFDADDVAIVRKKTYSWRAGSLDFLSVLWEYGLLGYQEEAGPPGRWVFHSLSEIDRTALPTAKNYAFHACLLDAVPSLSIAPGPPIAIWKD